MVGDMELISQYRIFSVLFASLCLITTMSIQTVAANSDSVTYYAYISAEYPTTTLITTDKTNTDLSVWTPELSFKAYVNEFPGSQVYCVGRITYSANLNKHKDFLEPRSDCRSEMLAQVYKFYVFKEASEKLQPISVMAYKSMDACRLKLDIVRSYGLWQHVTTFWVDDWRSSSGQYFVSNSNFWPPSINVVAGKYMPNLSWAPNFMFEAYDAEFPGSIPICVGRETLIAYLSQTRDIIKNAVNCEGNGFEHVYTMFVYPKIEKGSHHSFWVGNDPSNENYKIFHEQPSNESQWSEFFSFSADNWRPVPKYFYVSELNSSQTIVTRFDFKQTAGWVPKFMFQAYDEEFPGSMKICIGMERDVAYIQPETDCMEHFWVTYVSRQPGHGLMPVNVAVEIDKGSRLMFGDNPNDPNNSKYLSNFTFWTDGWHGPSILYFVSQSLSDTRLNRISVGTYETSSQWSQRMQFAAYSEIFPNSQVICVGRNRNRDRIFPISNCGNAEWDHVYKFYVFVSPGHGRVPITVLQRSNPVCSRVEIGEYVNIANWAMITVFYVHGLSMTSELTL